MDELLTHPLFPVPKVWYPFVVGVTAILVQWIVTGTFDRNEIAETAALFIYTAVGYTVPNGALVSHYDDEPVDPPKKGRKRAR